jgi:asparagine synthase (glutamine-hydrolysing)
MCGFFGWLKYGSNCSFSDEDINAAKSAILSLKHRGPDDFGEWKQSNLYMGHQRLKILDLSQKAAQPFLSTDKRYVLSYNGEIYNFIELRVELQKMGFLFRTDSDTEVFLNAFIAWEAEAFKKMEGMFAAAIHDTKTNVHYLVRDHLGQKPLYFHQHDEGFVYASEIRALLQLKSFDWKLDKENFIRFLMASYYAGNKTPVENVYKLLPGHFIKIENQKVQINLYWDSIPGENLLEIEEDKAVIEFETLFENACKICMRSDVPYGVLLSGGIDSSMSLRSCLKFKPDIDAFSVAMSEKDFDESAKAKQVADHHGVQRHKVYEMNKETVSQEFEHYLNILDEPNGDPAFVNMLFLSQSCKKDITVAVSGDGGDELFAGYATFMGLKFVPFFEALPKFIQSRLLQMAEKLLPASDTYLGLQFKALAYFQGFPSSRIMRYPLWLSTLSLKDLSKLCPNQPKEFFKASGLEGTIFDYEGAVMEKMKDKTLTQQLLYFYQKVFLPEFICLHTDRASMQSSFEIRSPFLMRSIIEFANSLPDNFKLEGNKLKKLLKLTVDRWNFPAKIINQKKQGFAFPVARWLKSELKPRLDQLTQDETLNELMDKEFLNQLISDHLEGKKNNYRILFNLIVFSAWKNKFPQVKIV